MIITIDFKNYKNSISLKEIELPTSDYVEQLYLKEKNRLDKNIEVWLKKNDSTENDEITISIVEYGDKLIKALVFLVIKIESERCILELKSVMTTN